MYRERKKPVTDCNGPELILVDPDSRQTVAAARGRVPTSCLAAWM